MKKYTAQKRFPHVRHSLVLTFCALSTVCISYAEDFTWTAQSGNWADGANWSGGVAADGSGAKTIFDSATSGNVVDLGGGTWTVGTLDFTGLWTLANGTINLDNAGGGIDIRTNTSGKTVIGPDVVLTGTGGFVKRGGSERTLVLAGNNTYSGVTRIAEGRVEIQSDNALGSSSGGNDYTLIDHTGNNYPQLYMSGGINISEELRLRLYATGTNAVNNTHLVSLAGGTNTLNGAMLLDRAGNSTGRYTFRVQAQGDLTINGNINGRLTDLPGSGDALDTRLQLSTSAGRGIRVNGVIADGTLANRGGLTLINDGAGSLTLSAANTYSGGTIILNGTTLFVNNTTGSATGTGGLEARTGTRLRGNGIIAPKHGSLVFQSGAFVQPGNGTVAGEKLTIDLSGVADPQYSVDFMAGAKIVIDISNADGASYLMFNGLSFADQVVFNNTVVDFSVLGTQVLADGLYTLATFSGEGSYTGNWVIGSGLEAYGAVELIYSDSSIQLRIGAIPEPATVATVLGAGALLAAAVVRRRTRAVPAPADPGVSA